MTVATVHVQKIRSPLLETLKLEGFMPKSRGKGQRNKKKMVAALILTSLVDAFSIMLLYLLVQNTGNGSTIELVKSGRLPIATEATALHDGTLVRIEGDRYFVNQQEIDEPSLAAKLQSILLSNRASGHPSGNPSETPLDNEALIVQADKDADFAKLASVIRAGSVSGFHQFKFAVLQGESH